MIKIVRNIVLTAMCLYALISVPVQLQAAAPEPLKVGAGQPYGTLGAAITAAQDGQVIQIVSNVTETNPVDPVQISKKVIIQGVGAPTYTVRNWTKEASPFQIAEADVTIQGLNIVINGAATTCSPIEITGDNVSLKGTTITLTGTTATMFAPILVNANGLTMEEVTIPSTVRAPIVVDLLGNSAVFKNVSITAPANTTGLYSAISPASLVLDACSFTATANTATLVSLPSPDGLTLTGCTFTLNYSASATNGYGLNFTEASAAAVTKTLKATDCVFNLNAPAPAIHLNGYNGVFVDCEFNYARAGTAIYSHTPGNADLLLKDCAFYIGKESGQKANSAKGVELKNNEQGNIMIDGCTLIASYHPEVATSASFASVITASDGTLRSLTVHNSTIALNAGAQNATGIRANAELVTISKSNFITNAKTAKCVVVNGVTNGTVSDSVFDIAQAGAAGLTFTNADAVYLKNNRYNLSTSGTGVAVTNAAAGASVVVADQSEIHLQGQASQGLLIENVSRLDIKNNTAIKAVSGGKGSAGIIANQVKEITIDGLMMDLNGATQGVAVDGTKFPQGEEGSVRIVNATAKLSGGAAKAINAIYANGVLIDRFSGICDDTANGSNLLSFLSSVDVKISNSRFELHKSATGINAAASTTATVPQDENGLIKEYRSGNYEIADNDFYVGENAKAIFFGSKDTHHAAIHQNLFKADHAAGIVTVGYGRSQLVYDNIFESVNSLMAIVSDGVDEIASFSMETDSDIYIEGEIVDAYRNQFYNNQLKGSYERGFYITNNGDVVRNNDFSEATFQYESTPGIIANTQLLVAYSKDVKILNNQFAKARAADNQIIRAYNATLSEVTGNTTQPVNGAPEVLFVQGTKAVAPNGVKYPERVAVHDVTNTINGIPPIEVVREWNDPDNLIYEYILRIPEHPYTVAYYKDFISDENLLAVEQGYSEFAEGHVLKSAEVAADLSADWLTLHQPDGYAGNIASNIDSLIIKNNPAENVVIVIYLSDAFPSEIIEPESSPIQPSVRRRAPDSETGQIYVEIDENEVPLAPPAPTNPNPQTGKNNTLSLFIWSSVSLIIASASFWISRKRKHMHHDS